MYRNARRQKDSTWLNVFVAAYPLVAIIIVTLSMVQPFVWYFRGGPLTGTREVETILTTVLSSISAMTWILLLAPLVIALIAIFTQSALHASTVWVTMLFIALLPLTFFGTENIFAPLAHLRVEYRAGDKGIPEKIWMLSKGGTALLVDNTGDEKRIILSSVSRSMVEPVANAVKGSALGTTWSCAEGGGDTLSMKSGRRKVLLEGCVSDEQGIIDGITEKDSFSVRTLLLLMDTGA